jgi:transposase
MEFKKYPLSFFEKKYKAEKETKVKSRIQMMLYLREGHTQREVSQMLRASVGIVPYWKARFEKQGVGGLNDEEGRGLKPKLSEEQLSMLGSAIDEGILMGDGCRRGFKTKDTAEFIDLNFGLAYTTRHCRRILKAISCSQQVPRPRNKRRNQKEADKFKKEFKKKEKVWVIRQ